MSLHLVSWHGTVLATGADNSELVQKRLNSTTTIDDAVALIVSRDEHQELDEELIRKGFDGIALSASALSGALLYKKPGQRQIHLKRDGRFLAAEASGQLNWNREEAHQWETFLLISDSELRSVLLLCAHAWQYTNGAVLQKDGFEFIAGFRVRLNKLEFEIEQFLNLNAPDHDASAERSPGILHDHWQAIHRLGRDQEPHSLRIPDVYRTAVRQLKSHYYLGNYQVANILLDQAVAVHGETDELLYYRRRVGDRLAPVAAGGPAILWRAKAEWELDWLTSILPSVSVLEEGQVPGEVGNRPLIVIDNHIRGIRASFYRRAFDAGCRIILFHLSDEGFRDDHEVYKWCRWVFRNYYSPLSHEMPNVSHFALGYKKGFADSSIPLPAAQRKYLWSFAGDPNKLTRREMLQNMRSLGRGQEHLTSGFNAPDSLNVDAYREMMRQSIFVPCPIGFFNLDSFRVYEALEVGCIPIVERRPGFDYFSEAYGPLPILSVAHWSEVAGLISHAQENNSVESLLLGCNTWWKLYKVGLKDHIATQVARASRS